MNFFNLFRRQIESKAPLPPPTIPSRPIISLSVVDAEEMVEDTVPTEGELGAAEGQTFAIEYEDSSGSRTTRRITVWSLKRSKENAPLMIAFCHERRAKRDFRMDRVISVIDMDGVVHEPPDQFFNEVFGTDLSVLQHDERKSKPKADQKKRIQNLARPGVQILTYLAHCDGRFDEEEFERIIQFIGQRCHLSDLEIEEGDWPDIIRWVRNMRPDEATTVRAVDRIIANSKTGERDLLLKFMNAVACSDDRICTNEFSFMQSVLNHMEEQERIRWEELKSQPLSITFTVDVAAVVAKHAGHSG